MSADADSVFWELIEEIQAEDPRLVEGTIMNGRCARVGKEFLALVAYKDSGLVVKLPRERVAELVVSGQGQPFGPGKKVFKEWLSVPELDRDVWRALLLEGIAFVS